MAAKASACLLAAIAVLCETAWAHFPVSVEPRPDDGLLPVEQAGPRDTGEMVPGMKDGKLYLYTVDEALRTRPDYEMRKKDVGEWRRNNLFAQFKAAGLELTPDVWERLAADRRQALEDDLAWIHP